MFISMYACMYIARVPFSLPGVWAYKFWVFHCAGLVIIQDGPNDAKTLQIITQNSYSLTIHPILQGPLAILQRTLYSHTPNTANIHIYIYIYILYTRTMIHIHNGKFSILHQSCRS